MATANEMFRDRRKKLGFSAAEVARRAGLNLSEYGDVEQHDDEAFRVVRLRNLRSLCEVLRLDLLDVFGIACAYCGGTGVAPRGVRLARQEVVRTRRTKLGMSEADLADRIGFDANTVVTIENNPDYLDDWPLELVLSLASVLDIPVQLLVKVRCSKCGQ